MRGAVPDRARERCPAVSTAVWIPLFLQAAKRAAAKPALIERLSSAQGHSAPGSRVEGLVSEDLSQCCLHRHPAALHDPSFSIADVGTGPAASARDAFKMNSPFQNAARTVRTDPCALEAADALIGMNEVPAQSPGILGCSTRDSEEDSPLEKRGSGFPGPS